MIHTIYGYYNHETIEFVYDTDNNEYHSTDSSYKIIRRPLPEDGYDIGDYTDLEERWALVTYNHNFNVFRRSFYWDIIGTGYICSTSRCGNDVFSDYYDILSNDIGIDRPPCFHVYNSLDVLNIIIKDLQLRLNAKSAMSKLLREDNNDYHLELLLSHDAMNGQLETLARDAVLSGNLMYLDMIVSYGADVNYVYDDSNHYNLELFGGKLSLLHYSLHNRKIDATRYLLALGADVNSVLDRHGRSLLHVLATIDLNKRPTHPYLLEAPVADWRKYKKSDLRCLVDLFQNHGLDIEVKDNHGCTALDYTSKYDPTGHLHKILAEKMQVPSAPRDVTVNIFACEFY